MRISYFMKKTNKPQDTVSSLNMRGPRTCMVAKTQLYSIFWVFFLFVFILFNDFSLSVDGYERTSLFKYHFIAGVHVSIVEVASLYFLFLMMIMNLSTGKVKISPDAMLIVVFAIVVLIVSAITGAYRLGSRTLVGMAELKALLLLIMMCIVSSHILSTGNRRLIIYLPAVLLCLRMLFEILRYFYFPYVDNKLGCITKVPNLALIYSPVFFACMLWFPGRFRKVFFGLSVFLINLVVVLSQSRATVFVSLASSALTILYLVSKSYRKRQSLLKFHIIAAVIMLTAVLLMIIFFYGRSTFVQSFAFWRPEDIPHARTNLAHYHDILRGITLIKDKPILGYGLGGQLPEFETAVFSELIHNEFLHFWITLGFLGSCLWIYAFVFLPLKSFRAFDLLRKNTVLKPEYFVLFTLFPYACTRILVSPPFYFRVSSIFYVAIVLAIQFSLISEAGQLPVAERKCNL